MRRSEYLIKKIVEVRERLTVVQSPGWERFSREVLDKWEYEAFLGWTNTPAEETAKVLELQIKAKAVSGIRRWADLKVGRQQLAQYEEELRQVRDKEVQDEVMEEQPIPGFLGRLAYLKRLITRFAT